MGVRVRVRNFQSIEDATVVIDGLTVVTGPNNSGKTALMRAIRGVFTNAPAGPLVRHGCSHLTVSLTFDDGTEVVWEKGWSKPDRKGKTVNRYTINGEQISGVGRGVPPEVEALGVREISAASDRIWPQIAQQFDGTLFLVNRPGSAVAEALSDVERVGKLSSALKASEKDRRSVNSELKVRRKDLISHERRVEHYDGLEALIEKGDELHAKAAEIEGVASEITALTETKGRYEAVSRRVEELASFDPTLIPDPTRVEKLCRGIQKVSAFQRRYESSLAEATHLQSFRATVPSGESVVTEQNALREHQALHGRYTSAVQAAAHYAGFSPLVLDTTATEALPRKIEMVTALLSRHREALALVGSVEETGERILGELAEAETEVTHLLGERGVCPTCNTLHEGGHP